MGQAAAGRRTSRAVRVACLLSLTAALVWLDNLTGPFIPFTVFYIALLYFTMTRVGSTWSYLVALISAAGHTYGISHTLLHRDQLGFAAWQFATSFSVLSLFCVLLDRRRYARPFQAAAAMPEIPSQPLEGPPNRRVSLFTGGTDRYTQMFFLVSLAFLAAFVPWIHDSESPQPYCPGYGESTTVADTGTSKPAQGAAAARTKMLLLTVAGGPADFDADNSILDGLDRHLAKSVWLVDCAGFDPSVDAHATRNLQTLRRLAREGHVIAIRGHAAPEAAYQQAPQGMPREAATCGELVRDATGTQPLEFGSLLADFPHEAKPGRGDGGESAVHRQVDFNSTLETQAGANPPMAPMEQLIGSLRSNDIVVIHDSRLSARHLDTFLTLAEKNGYSFGLPTGRPPASN